MKGEARTLWGHHDASRTNPEGLCRSGIGMAKKRGDSELAGKGKYTRPDVEGAVRRLRLFRLIDRGRRKPLLWLSGPAGSGKTTLIASYVADRGLQCLWYQVDPGDADPSTFFYYLGLAARAANPRKRRPMPMLTPEYAMGVPAFTRRFFDRLFSLLSPPAILVFDNVQEAATAPEFLDVLRHGLAHVPEGIIVVLVSREAAPPELARMRLGGGLAEIGWKELKLTESESRAIARGRLRTGVDLRDIHARASGWIAGLLFLLDGAEGGVPDTFDPRNVFDYFAAEVFRSSPPATRDFLLRTAYVPAVTESMADEIVGERRAGRVLRELARKNHFTSRHIGAEAVYSYHPLYRAFLLDRAAGELPQDELLEIIHRSASALSAAGRIEEAAGLFIEEKNWNGLGALVMERAPLLIAQGRNQVLQGWLGSMPDDTTSTDPWLLYWMGVAWLPFAPARAQADLASAFRLFDAAGETTGRFASWAGAVEAIIYGFENFGELDAWISRLDDLERSAGGVPDGWIGALVISAMFSALVMRQPSHRAFDTWCGRALAVARNSGNLNLRARTLLHYLYYLELSGKFSETARVVAELRSLRKASDAPALAVLTATMAEAMAETWTGDGVACRQAVDAGLELAERTGMHMFDFMIAGQGAFGSLNDGSTAAARSFLDFMEKALAAHRPWDESLYSHLRAMELVAAGRLNQAREYALRALDCARHVGAYQSITQTALLCAQISAAIGEPQVAAAFAAEALSVAETTLPESYLEFHCLLVRAQVLLKGGEEREGLPWLQRALAFGRARGFMNLHIGVWPRRDLALLYTAALVHGIEPDYVKACIRRGGVVPDDSSGTEDWPYPFRIRTLGAFAIEAGGKILSFSGKTPRKPLALLKTLIALGVREVPVDRIMDALWPDADGAAANRSFTAALHRMRKLLDDDGLFTLAAGRLSLDLGRCFVDAPALEQLLDRAAGATDPGARAGMLERAIASYAGDFLEADQAEAWAAAYRERLKQRILSAIGELASLREESENWAAASAFYGKGLEINPLVEEFYRGIMRCHLARGENAAAVLAYRRCREALATGLRVLPSDETELLRRRAAEG